ncbi:hypothetical protein SHKM778_84610 [Streptomyces sp. KM77-8]|uniref:N-acetyltransferase domain-containing protein n=1 Tax=Streptomyces haneummycinicus TaxID=3074435 RepID=A0AAT9HX26_9ACTN
MGGRFDVHVRRLPARRGAHGHARHHHALPGDGEIGFWGAKEHRGNGYITEAALAASRWAFTRMSVDRVEWRAEVGNTASRAVAERAGFTVEGVLRSSLNNKGCCGTAGWAPCSRPTWGFRPRRPTCPGWGDPGHPRVVSGALYRADV